MLKKFSLFLVMLVLMLFSVNAGTTYLNSCGKNSGWLDNETYILNFTEIPSGYANNYCFLFPELEHHNNITITGIGEIDVKKTNLLFFYIDKSIQTDFIFEDISLYSSDNTVVLNSFFYLLAGNNRYSRLLNSNQDNITIDLPSNSIYYLNTGTGSTLRDVNVNNNNVSNFLIKQPTTYFLKVNAGYYAPYGNPTFNNNNFLNSFINTVTDFSLVTLSSNPYQIQNNIFNKSVMYSQNPSINYGRTGTGKLSLTYFYNNLVSNEIRADTNDDGISEFSDTYNIYPHIYVELTDYVFYQDFTEGEDIWASGPVPNKRNIFINDEQIPNGGVIAPFSTPNAYDNEFLGTTIIDLMSAFIINGGIDCSLISTDYCFIQDSASYNVTSTNNLKGLLNIGGVNIQYINFSKVGNNNAHIISNYQDVVYSNQLISNNVLSKSDDNFKYGNNYFVKLKGNNITIRDNIFNLITSINGGYEVLNIDSLNPTGNTVTTNQFIKTAPNSTTDSEIFVNDSATLFYNNYIDNQIVTSLSAQPNLNVTPFIGFAHTDGKIYFYHVGNYYVNNTACVDADLNGFCDSSFTSGVITDTNPLASYPFVFTSHLLSAELVVDTIDFNITLVEPIANSSKVIAGAGSPINFTYYHDSDFIDLDCYYIIDGSNAYTDFNVPKLTNRTQSFTGWTEKAYTFRVECTNAYNYKVSNEIIFNVSFTTVIPPTSEGVDTSDAIGIFSGLYDSSATTTGDNVIGIFSLFEGGFGIMTLLGFIFVFLAIFMVIFALIMFMFK